ncbi:reverse transcriptase family protein [Parasphingopyxis lamellibrachiae]|nr:reverse transcriptase family protein [Parasphingopyxis lamellibrachiae]
MNAKYRVFRLKRSGRQVEEPPPPLQSLHRQIHGYLSRIETPNYLHSNRKGRSYISNAKPHVGALAMIKIDVKKFFPSVEQHKVMHFFRDDLKCAADVAGLLAALLCKDGKLPTGSSSSPIISYYAYKAMFDDIQSFAAKNHLVMTCYVDDITLSGANATLRQLHEVRKIIMRHGLRAHKAKWFMGLGAKPVTGVMVTKNGIELPHSRWKAIKADLKAIKQCANREEKLEIYPKLVSRLYEASQIDPGCRKLADIHHRLWKEALAGDVQLAA